MVCAFLRKRALIIKIKEHSVAIEPIFKNPFFSFDITAERAIFILVIMKLIFKLSGWY